MKKLLFISPDVGGFCLDIINEMHRQGYDADYIRDMADMRDPDHVRSVYFNKGEKYKQNILKEYKTYWIELLSQEKYSKKYDILFVIDGRRLHHVLFDILKLRNPNIRTINYLFDTTRSIYRFNCNFKYFDKIVTYDKQDAEQFGLELLPIPWCKTDNNESIKYAFFAMGSYIESRYKLFKFIEDIAKQNNLKCFLKVFTKKVKLYPFKYFVDLFLGKKRNYLSPLIYYSDIITNDFISKESFTRLMLESEVIVDSIDERQDGLTARCTWALGAGKKVITNNKSIKTYDFYTSEQILVVQDYSEKTRQEVLSFLKTPLVLRSEIKSMIEQFRIDNWLYHLLKPE